MGIGIDIYRLSFQISPIVLTGGVASLMPGGMLPILQLLSIAFDDLDLNRAFANFRPMPGSTLIEQKIGNYTFANQSVAANAVIVDPLTLSMMMEVHVREDGGYALKLAIMTAMQAMFAQHNTSGGTYTVATPSFFYTDLVMTRMSDASDASKQAQNAYVLEFVKPLVSLTQAAQAQNASMSKISAQLPNDGSLSGIGQSVGVPQTLATPDAASLGLGQSGSSVAGLNNQFSGLY